MDELNNTEIAEVLDMVAILNDQAQVIGYTTPDRAADYVNTAPVAHADYMIQLAAPGVYTKAGTAWTFAKYTPPPPTLEEQAEIEDAKRRTEQAVASLELLRDQANAKATTLPVSKLLRIKSLLTSWASLIGKALTKTATPYVTHLDDLYLVNQDVAVVQAHQPPGPGTEALYSKVAPPGTIAPWAQPLGAHDAYNKPDSGLPKSDPVTHNGQTWISTVNANTWAPGVYGWIAYTAPILKK